MAKCSKCGSDEHDEHIHACRRCGTSLAPNHCTGPDCEKHSKQDLPDNAEFCPLCGLETSYALNNIINPRIR